MDDLNLPGIITILPIRKQNSLEKQKKLKKTTEQFIQEAIQIHSDRYDYSKVEYVIYRSNRIYTDPINPCVIINMKNYVCVNKENGDKLLKKVKTIP
jgi:hypothetical protein